MSTAKAREEQRLRLILNCMKLNFLSKDRVRKWRHHETVRENVKTAVRRTQTEGTITH